MLKMSTFIQRLPCKSPYLIQNRASELLPLSVNCYDANTTILPYIRWVEEMPQTKVFMVAMVCVEVGGQGLGHPNTYRS